MPVSAPPSVPPSEFGPPFSESTSVSSEHDAVQKKKKRTEDLTGTEYAGSGCQNLTLLLVYRRGMRTAAVLACLLVASVAYADEPAPAPAQTQSSSAATISTVAFVGGGIFATAGIATMMAGFGASHCGTLNPNCSTGNAMVVGAGVGITLLVVGTLSIVAIGIPFRVMADRQAKVSLELSPTGGGLRATF
jgi:hypothetical protein